MKIGIIGAGAIGKTYGKLFSQAGYEVMLSSRHPEDIEAGNYQIGTFTEAAAFGEVIILAVNYRTVDEAISQIKDHLWNVKLTPERAFIELHALRTTAKA